MFILRNPSDLDFIPTGDTRFLQELIKDTKICTFDTFNINNVSSKADLYISVMINLLL